MVSTIGAHLSPLELEIEKRDNAELIQIVITIGVHWSWRLRRETMLSRSRQWLPLEPIGWSPFELEIEKRDNAEMIQIVITIGDPWSPLELEIENRDNAELITIGIPAYNLLWPPDVEFSKFRLQQMYMHFNVYFTLYH